ncbi:MAG: hypothetical protein BWY75_03486 [bacterium ADurb.Bin425]|nr:MAG: hypothetical protein BWY75_03486 [bacterium ADurb.Bin425]
MSKPNAELLNQKRLQHLNRITTDGGISGMTESIGIFAMSDFIFQVTKRDKA